MDWPFSPRWKRTQSIQEQTLEFLVLGVALLALAGWLTSRVIMQEVTVYRLLHEGQRVEGIITTISRPEPGSAQDATYAFHAQDADGVPVLVHGDAELASDEDAATLQELPRTAAGGRLVTIVYLPDDPTVSRIAPLLRGRTPRQMVTVSAILLAIGALGVVCLRQSRTYRRDWIAQRRERRGAEVDRPLLHGRFKRTPQGETPPGEQLYSPLDDL